MATTADALPRQPETSSIDARVVKALSHPTRVHILGLLRERELVSPVQLANELGLALGTVGYHVRRLEQLGFIELAKQTQKRGAVEHHYRVRTMLDPPQPSDAPKRRTKSRTQQRGAEACVIVRDAQAVVAAGGFDAVAARGDVCVVTLDASGRVELLAGLDALTAAIERIERSSKKRLAAAGAAAAPHICTAVSMLFEVDED